MIPLRRWKIASYKHQIVFSSHIKTLEIFLNVNLIILGPIFLPLNQKLIRKKKNQSLSPASDRITRILKYKTTLYLCFLWPNKIISSKFPWDLISDSCSTLSPLHILTFRIQGTSHNRAREIINYKEVGWGKVIDSRLVSGRVKT